jgi:DNA polymerase-3 subunit alpha
MQRAKDSAQHGLFGGAAAALAPAPEVLPDADEWPEHEMLAAEYSTLGFYISGHPLDKYAGKLADLKVVDFASLEGRKHKEDVVVAGIVVGSRAMRSRRGARWAILTLQDRTGVCESLVFPEAFSKLESVLKPATPLLVKGTVSVEDGATRLFVTDARMLDQVVDRPPSLLRVRIPVAMLGADAMDELQDLFAKRPGKCRVEFELVLDDGAAATQQTNKAVQADQALLDRVREICGADSVVVK